MKTKKDCVVKVDLDTGEINWKHAIQALYGDKVGKAVVTLLDVGFTSEMYAETSRIYHTKVSTSRPLMDIAKLEKEKEDARKRATEK